MINCPKCGHPVSGRARSCGYCGESLVNNYFAREERHKGKDPLLEAPAGAAGICAMVLGIFGCLALLAARAFQLMVMFGYGGSVPPEIDRNWWIRTLVLAVPSVVLLVQELILGGSRGGLLFDSFWLFASGCGLILTIQCYTGKGSGLFFDVVAIPYLLIAGCALVVISSVTSILAYKHY